MQNSQMLDLPRDQILETLQTPSTTLHQSDVGTCLAHLKSFDYYYILAVVDPQNFIHNQFIKLPSKFVEKHGENPKMLLDKFLEITGIPFGSNGNSLIMPSLVGKDKRFYLDPITYNRGQHMVFALEKGETLEFMFLIDIVRYRDFLMEYNVR